MKKSNRVSRKAPTARPNKQVRGHGARANNAPAVVSIPPRAFRALVPADKTSIPIDPALAALAEVHLSKNPELGSLGAWVERLLTKAHRKHMAGIKREWDLIRSLRMLRDESRVRLALNLGGRSPIGFRIQHEDAVALIRLRLPNLIVGYGESSPIGLYWATPKEKERFAQQAKRAKTSVPDYLTARFTARAQAVSLGACDYESIAATMRAFTAKALAKIERGNKSKEVRK